MNWAYNVKTLLNKLGFRIYWQCEDFFTPTFCKLKLRVRDTVIWSGMAFSLYVIF